MFLEKKMIKKCILHIGPPKTGTTLIQAALTNSSSILAENGIYYPPAIPISNEGHHALAYEALEKTGHNVVRTTKAQISWETILRDAHEGGFETLILSSEEFSNEAFDKSAYAYISNILGNAKITVLYGARDPFLSIPSTWQQTVKWGLGNGTELLSLDGAIEQYKNTYAIQIKNHISILTSRLNCDIVFLYYHNMLTFRNC